jgi:hypothetical protein
MTLPLHISVLEFNFPLPLPLWVTVGFATAAVVSAIYLYHRQKIAADIHTIRILTLLRILALFTAVVLLLAPVLVRASQHHSRGRLYLLLDDSRSMSRVDPGQTQSRAALAEEALQEIQSTLDRFDVTLVALSRPESLTPTPEAWFSSARSILDNPQAPSTPIGQVLAHVAAESDVPSTLLLVSDGRQNQGRLPEPAARELAGRGSRLFALSVGSARVVRDAAVDSIDAPPFILAGDDASLSATLRLDAIDQPVTATLTRDDKTVATKTIRATPVARVDFIDPAPPQGEHVYAVSVTPLPGEATAKNNRLATKLTVRREKIHVLLLDDEPRWEYQFLKTLLQLDSAVDLKVRLLRPARIENIPSPPPDPLPATAQDWSRFDVVIHGDVSPAGLTPTTQSNLATALREGKPKSLILIAGPRNLPSRYAGSPISALLPVDLTQSSSTTGISSEGFIPRFAPEVETSTLARLLPDEQLNRGFWSAFPPFYWHDEHTFGKPAAQVLWETGSSSSSRTALLSALAYGSGRVLYLATPETWRLRYVQAPDGQVVDLHRRFWSQVLRWSIAGEPAREDFSTRDVEDENQSADPARLTALAKAGNGAAFDVSDAARLAQALPATDHVQARTTRLGLFEDPQKPSTRYLHWAAFLVFVALLSAEWIVRKRKGLV